MEKSDTTMIDSSLSVFTDDTESDDIMVISMSSFSFDEHRPSVKRDTRREAAPGAEVDDELTEVDTDSILTLSDDDDDDISLTHESFSRPDDLPSESSQRVLVITNSDWSKQDMKIVRLLCESLIKRDNELNEVESLQISRIFKDTLYVKCKTASNFQRIWRSQSISVDDQDRLKFLPAFNTHNLVIKHHASAIDSVETYLSNLLTFPVEVDLIAEDCLIAKLDTWERCEQVLSMRHSIDGNHELIIEYLYNTQLLDQPLIKCEKDPRSEFFTQPGQSFMTSSVIIPKLVAHIDMESQPLLPVLREFDPAWTKLCTELLKLSATAWLDEKGSTLRIECNDDGETAHLTWSDDVKQLVVQFLSQLVSKQVKFNAEELQKLVLNNERLVIKEKDDGCLVIGYKKEVEELIKTAEDLENSRESSITLDGFLSHQLKMLLRCKFIATMAQKHQIKRDQIQIDLNAGSVTIRGTTKQIRHAKEEIKEIIGSIVKKEISTLDPMIIKFIKKRESELVEWLISHGYQCVLSADMASSVLTIYSTSRQNDTDRCFNGLTEAIQCQKVDSGLILNIEEEELLDFLNEVTNPFRGAIYHYQDRILKLCGFSTELQSIAEQFTQQFIK